MIYTPRSCELPSSTYENGFVVDVPFPFVSKSNFRRFVASRNDNAWKKFASFEDALSTVVRQAAPAQWENPGVEIALPKRPVIVVVLYARTALDAGNLPKSALDALEGVLYANDAQVAHVTAFATRTRSDQRGYLAAAQLAAGTTPLQVLTAARHLSTHAWDWWVTQENLNATATEQLLTAPSPAR